MTDEDLIREWYSLCSATLIARDYRVQHHWVIREWRRLKAAGKLPPGDRPRRDDASYRAEGESTHDGRPSVGSDDLLALLEKGLR